MMRMSDLGRSKDLVVVSSLNGAALKVRWRQNRSIYTYRHGLISKEVNFRKARDVLQGVSLVPPARENIKANLAADGELEVESVSKLLLKDLDHLGADSVLLVVLLELNAFLLRAVSAYGGNV